MSEFPEGWVTAPLASIADVQLGRQRSPKNHVGPNMRPYLRAANVTWDGLALDDVKEMHFSSTEVARFRLIPGDILLSEASGSASEVGKPAVWRGEIDDCCFQNTLLRVRTRHPRPSYLLWFFKWLAVSGQFGRGSRGVGIHHLGARALSEWDVPVAPVGEQERIVAAIEEQFSRLDVADAALERVRHNLRRMRVALLQALVGYAPSSALPDGWQWVTVRDVAGNETSPVLTGPFGTTLSRSDFVPDGIPVLTIGCITRDGIKLHEAPRVSRAKAFALGRYRLARGDVLFSRMATVGRAAVVGDAEAGSIINYHLMRLRLDQNVLLPKYLTLLCQGSRAIHDYLDSSNHGVTRPGINTRQLLDLPVALPPMREQQQIVSRVEEVDALRNQFAGEIDRAQRLAQLLRSSIFAAAFSGKLVPQDSDDEPASFLLNHIAVKREPSSDQRSDGPRNRRKEVTA